MIEDGKPEHWPKMVAGDDKTEQGATRALAEVRRLIVEYYKRDDDWRSTHAKSDYIVNVVAGLIADARAIDELHKQADRRARKVSEENEHLRAELAESKRPFLAQMEMQNRRIIALTEEIDGLRLEALHPAEREGGKT